MEPRYLKYITKEEFNEFVSSYKKRHPYESEYVYECMAAASYLGFILNKAGLSKEERIKQATRLGRESHNDNPWNVLERILKEFRISVVYLYDLN
jgi:hypothetical protein